MAKVLQDIFTPGIDEVVQAFTINSWHVSQSVDALTGVDAYDITISGSLDITGPMEVSGSITQIPSTVTTATSTDNLLSIDLATGKFTVGEKLTTITGSFLTTASVSNDTITFTKGNGNQFSLVVNNVVSASYAVTSSYGQLVQTLTSNQNVGGISSGNVFQSGSSIEALLRSLLIAYIEPTISSLVIRLDGSSISTATRDVNQSFTCNTSSFSATIDNPNENFPVSASITASGADIGTQQVYLSNTTSGTNVFPLGSILTINRASSAGTVTFTVNTKSQTTVDTQSTSTSFSFLYRNYLAASSTVIFDNATAQSVIDTGTVTSQLDTNRSWTPTCTSANTNVSNFTYIIYPATYGDLTSVVQDNAFEVLPAFTKIGDFNITNSFSATTSFRVYQSNQPGAFQPGATLTIS